MIVDSRFADTWRVWRQTVVCSATVTDTVSQLLYGDGIYCGRMSAHEFSSHSVCRIQMSGTVSSQTSRIGVRSEDTVLQHTVGYWKDSSDILSVASGLQMLCRTRR